MIYDLFSGSPRRFHTGNQIGLFGKQQGLSLHYLGKAADITSQQVQKCKSGIKRISASRIYQFAIILDCDVIDFLSKHQNPDNSIELTSIITEEI